MQGKLYDFKNIFQYFPQISVSRGYTGRLKNVNSAPIIERTFTFNVSNLLRKQKSFVE